MSDLISRKEALEICKTAMMPEEMSGNMIYLGLKNLPSVESKSCEYWDDESYFCALHRPSAEPKKGKWITSPYADNDSVTNYRCPFCETGFSYVSCTQAKPNFCMNCGADMRGEEDEGA